MVFKGSSTKTQSNDSTRKYWCDATHAKSHPSLKKGIWAYCEANISTCEHVSTISLVWKLKLMHTCKRVIKKGNVGGIQNFPWHFPYLRTKFLALKRRGSFALWVPRDAVAPGRVNRVDRQLSSIQEIQNVSKCHKAYLDCLNQIKKTW